MVTLDSQIGNFLANIPKRDTQLFIWGDQLIDLSYLLRQKEFQYLRKRKVYIREKGGNVEVFGTKIPYSEDTYFIEQFTTPTEAKDFIELYHAVKTQKEPGDTKWGGCFWGAQQGS